MRYFLGKGSCRFHHAYLFSKEIHFRLSVYDVLIMRRGDGDKEKRIHLKLSSQFFHVKLPVLQPFTGQTFHFRDCLELAGSDLIQQSSLVTRVVAMTTIDLQN
jgi:hypothetical protein